MERSRVPSIFRIKTKNTLGSIFLVANPLVWYSAVIFFLQNTLSQMSSNGTLSQSDSVLIWIIHFSGIIFAALFGTLLTRKIEKNRFLLGWMALGTISSIFLFAMGTLSVPIMSFVVLLLGVSLGIGMPACMGYYTDTVPIENRGRISGIVMLFTGLGIFAFTTFSSTNPIVLGIVLAGWRLSSFLVFYIYKSRTVTMQVKEVSSFKNVLSQQSFLLYLIPWIMFSLINYLAGPVQELIVGKETAIVISVLQNIMMAVFAVIGGFLLDIIGRKRIAIFGFVMLGIDTATLGLFPKELWSNYFSATVDGIAFGFLWVIFIVTIWGDLSHNINSSKYYAIGVIPFFASKFLELTVGKDVSNFINVNVGTNGLFSFLAFFLFLAVLPLVYAPETLPEKVLKDRDLKSYVNKAMMKVEKESTKGEKNEDLSAKTDTAESKTETEKSLNEYEEAQKLAEKYY